MKTWKWERMFQMNETVTHIHFGPGFLRLRPLLPSTFSTSAGNTQGRERVMCVGCSARSDSLAGFGEGKRCLVSERREGRVPRAEHSLGLLLHPPGDRGVPAAAASHRGGNGARRHCLLQLQ